MSFHTFILSSSQLSESVANRTLFFSVGSAFSSCLRKYLFLLSAVICVAGFVHQDTLSVCESNYCEPNIWKDDWPRNVMKISRAPCCRAATSFSETL